MAAEGRGLYGLINNAGVAVMGPLIETPESELDFLFNVNVYGPYRVTKGFADLIIESEGRILNVTSIGGVVSAPFSGVYSMSKHALEAYTDSLAAEMERFGVRVAAVLPYGGGDGGDGKVVACYDGRASAEENCEERTGVALGESFETLEPLGEAPAAESPYGGLRYLSAVALPDGGWRVYYEATRADGAHELRTEIHSPVRVDA